MALTPEQILAIAGTPAAIPGSYIYSVARAIEAEVRKDDEALIRQLVDALEKIDAAMPFPVAKKAIAAGRARLEGKSNDN